MAKTESIVTVRFLNAIEFNNSMTSQLNITKDKCVLASSAHGVEALSARSHVFVPFANIAFVRYAVEAAEVKAA